MFMDENQKGIKSSLHLLRYLEALVDEFPHPIRATQLAKLVGVTKASITKMHKRLLDLCDTKISASSKSFVLKSDPETLAKVFLLFALTGSHREFLRSNYVSHVMSGENIHRLLSLHIPNYKMYFEVDDTSFIVSRFLDFLFKLEPSFVVNVLKSLLIDTSQSIPIQFIVEMENLLPAVFRVKSESDFLALMRVRDKTYFLIRDFLWAQIQSLSIVKSKQSKERTNYLNVYKETVDFYLRYYAAQVDKLISKALKDDGHRRWKIPSVGTVVLESNYVK